MLYNIIMQLRLIVKYKTLDCLPQRIWTTHTQSIHFTETNLTELLTWDKKIKYDQRH